MKKGTSGVLIDYEHVLFAGPPLWKYLFCLFQELLLYGSICSTLKIGIILPLFKGKGAKANNKENYRGITLFPTLCKIYEIILPNQLENYASHNQYFSEMQFRFQEGVRCIEASFTILEIKRVLNEPLQYEEVAKVCSRLKKGTSGVLIDYEHVLFAGPPLWKYLFCLFQELLLYGSICSTLKIGIILPLFKGKGAKANNKENYRGITLFPTLCKIYEIILPNQLENYASHNQYFSEMQFRFQEGVRCIEASFTILEITNHMLERGSKIFGCFLDVRKAFDTV